MTTAATSTLPLLGAGVALDAPICWRSGRAISRAQFLQDVQNLAAILPTGGPVLAMTADRYRFVQALAAAMLRGQAALLPPNLTPDMIAWLQVLFPQAYALREPATAAVALPSLEFPPECHATARPPIAMPSVPGELEIAHVLTSGSTGRPVPHPKRWDLMVGGALAGAERIAAHLGRPDLHGVTVVGTVPAHHMFGFESTVMLPMAGGGAFAAERPFFPSDVAGVLASVPRPRVLVTTPVHLKALVESGVAMPSVDLMVSATAPLSVGLAQRAEATFGGPLMEIYGCTEAGQVASRRTSVSAEWLTVGELHVSGDGHSPVVGGGHLAGPIPLADVLEILSPGRFRLLGRSNDMVNVAGKRTSLAHLNHQLTSVEGVRDGAFWLPPGSDAEQVVRLVALVVAPGLDRATLLRALRERIDAAFLPRPLFLVDALPRDPSGKLSQAALARLAAGLLEGSSRA